MTIISITENSTPSEKKFLSENNSAIGIMGGTFDPVHFGHLRAAVEFAQAFSLSSVRLLPCHIPAHRVTPGSSAQHRVKMLELAIAECDSLSIDEVELHSKDLSFTISTLRALRTQIGLDVPVYFALGSDAFNNIETWKDWQELFSLANFVVLKRPSTEVKIENPLLKQRMAIFNGEYKAFGYIYELTITAIDISATQIRQLIKNAQSIKFLLPRIR